MDTLELTLPAHYTCPLYYGDDTGLEDEDQKKVDQIRDYVTAKGYRHEPIDLTEGGFYPRGSFDMQEICQCHQLGDMNIFTFAKA